MATLKTFMFDFDFDDDQLMKQMVNEDTNDVDTTPLPEPEIISPTFSEAELNAARQAGFDAGKENGITETMAELENSISQSLSTIVNEIMELSNQQSGFNQQIKIETIELLNKLIGKLFPAMNERLDIDETIQFSRSILPELLTEPRITFHVPENLDQEIKSRIEPILKDNGYAGELIVIGEAETPVGACSVDWSSGSAERNSELLLSEIEKRFLDAIDNELLTKDNNNLMTSAEISGNEGLPIDDQDFEKANVQGGEINHPETSENENLSMDDQDIDYSNEQSSEFNHPAISGNESLPIDDQDIDNSNEQGSEFNHPEITENENLPIDNQDFEKANEQSSEISNPEIPDKSSFEEPTGTPLNHDDTTVEQDSDKQNENYEQTDENS